MKYSASGIDLLRSCERLFFYRYNMKNLTGAASVDCDAAAKAGMERGDIFHNAWEAYVEDRCSMQYIIEQTKKKVHVSVNRATREKRIAPIFNKYEHPAIFLTMVDAYKNFLDVLKDKTGLEELCLELGFETEMTRGFTDAILYNKSTGAWSIQDKKTRAVISEGSTANISNEPQFMFYYCHINEIIALVKQRTGVTLLKDAFLGIHVCEIQCPSKARKKKRGVEKEIVTTRQEQTEYYDTVITVKHNPDAYEETLEEFFERLVKEKAVGIKQTFVPASELDAKDFWDNQMAPTIQRAMELEEAFKITGEVQGIKNTGNCISKYGSPCDYWSQCHKGKTYSETIAEIEKDTISVIREK